MRIIHTWLSAIKHQIVYENDSTRLSSFGYRVNSLLVTMSYPTVAGPSLLLTRDALSPELGYLIYCARYGTIE